MPSAKIPQYIIRNSSLHYCGFFTKPRLKYLGHLLANSTMWQTQIKNISRCDSADG